MPDLEIQILDHERLADAYPLVRSGSRVSLQRWMEFGRQLNTANGGVLAVVGADNCVHGVASFRPRPNLRHRQSLDVELFVAFELPGTKGVRAMLYEGLERLAAERQCESLTLTTAAKGYEIPLTGSQTALENLGLKLETLNYTRELEPAGQGQARK
jgi:hypothetical protein